MDNKSSGTYPTPAELEKINAYSRKELKAQEVYVFPVILCDNEVDRDCERFSMQALDTLAKLFAGKTGISDHSGLSRDQKARIFEACVITLPDRKTSAGEPYTYIRAKAYMLRTDENASLMAEIDAGIKKEVSVGCAVKEKICSICGASLRDGCEHIKGRSYGGEICHTVLCEPADAYEWSFVAVPAQKEAGVTKSFEIHKGSADGEESELALYGRLYREEMTAEIVKQAGRFLPGLNAETARSVCNSLNFEQMKALKNAFEEKSRAGALSPLQLGGTVSNAVSPDEYKI